MLLNEYRCSSLKLQQRGYLGNTCQPYGSVLCTIRKITFANNYSYFANNAYKNVKLRKPRDLFNIEI